MKIRTFLFKNLWMSTIVLTNFYLQCMQINNQELALEAELYNQNQLIMFHPNEILIHIFSYCSSRNAKEEQTLNALIRRCIQLKMVCKRFNNILTITTLGELYTHHRIEDKDKVLEEITGRIVSSNYWMKRPGVLILLHSGANANVDMHTRYSADIEIQSANFSLLHKALIRNDTNLITLLFKYNADPNQIHPNEGPLFFFAPTPEIADLFFKNGVDLNAKDKGGNNVLSHVHRLSFELLDFYIEHKVDPRYINPLNNTCILHALANPNFNNINNSHDFYKKGVLLIKLISDMVNTLDKEGRTPIDLMEKKIEREFYNNSIYYDKPFKKLICLYKSHYGAKTAKELRQEKELYTNYL